MRRWIIGLLMVIVMSGCLAQTNVWGDVSGVWDISGSPYIVHDTIRVATGDTLVITPGVDVIFLGHYRLFVDSAAVLKALGTVTDSIRFLPSDTGEWSPGWHGIRFYYASDACSLSYCEMAYGHAHGLTWEDSCGGAVWVYASTVTLNNCLLRDCGANGSGGGIYLQEASGVISQCDITLCESDGYGGGIYTFHFSGIIEECNLEHCRSLGRGGGLFSSRGGEFTGCIIRNNEASIGGGISISGGSDGSGTFDSNIIDSNVATEDGGGVCLWGEVVFTNNTVSNNVTEGDGGGIWMATCAEVFSFNFIRNNCADNGGGIYREDHFSGGSIVSNTISNNIASGFGGGIDARGNIHILNNYIGNNVASNGGGISAFWDLNYRTIGDNIISDNEATEYGGGMYISNNADVLRNRINNNSASNGAGIYCGGCARISNNVVVENNGGGLYFTGEDPVVVNNTIVANNGDGLYIEGIRKGMINTILYDNSGFEINATSDCSLAIVYSLFDSMDINIGGSSVVMIGPGNISADPLFEDTLFHLAEGSPCINSGAEMFYFPTISDEIWADTFDFEGGHRPVRAWDIGADEYDTSTGITEIPQRPITFSLSAHPNPFNSAVNISAPAGAEVEVFDLNGRKISTLRPSGTSLEKGGQNDSPLHKGGQGGSYVWQPDESVGSGVYLVRATMGEETATKRVVYLK